MRAGAFAEKRVIDLVNRRFVPCFFSTGGPGKGQDRAAQAFVKEKTKNRYAFLAVFTPEGECVAESDLYADKDAVFDLLRRVLDERPSIDQASVAEKDVLSAAATSNAGIESHLSAGLLLEELGRYDEALTHLAKVGAIGGDATLAALPALARIHRYRRDWQQHAATISELDRAGSTEPLFAYDASLERGLALLARNEKEPLGEARTVLQRLAASPTTSTRTAEAHYYAGVACWKGGDREWAKFHWCHIVKNLADDRFYMRAYISAAAEAMPYANPELDGYEAPVGNIGTDHIVRGVEAAMKSYELLRPFFERGELTALPEKNGKDRVSATSSESVFLLVAALRDGNDHRVANNEIVQKLERAGAASVVPLMAALDDEVFPGRGYASFALGVVLGTLETKPAAALDKLRSLLESKDPYVAALTRSALKRAGEN